MNRTFSSKYLISILLVIDLVFCIIRFININADFPSGITTSGVLYTDEGNYAASAIRHYLTGSWYLNGDLNFAVTQPGNQVLERISFAIFGLSLFSARIVVAIFFLLFVVILALWVRKHYGNPAALLTILVLSTNFYAFAYSRLALRFLIALFFIVASLFVADHQKNPHPLFRIALASFLFSFAVLTYTPASFALPLLLFIAWKNGTTVKNKLFFTLAFSLLIIIVLGIYYYFMLRSFPADISMLSHVISSSFISSFAEWLRNLYDKVILGIKNLGADFTIATILLCGFAFFTSYQFRTNKLVQILIAYTIIYIAVLSIDKYGPPRYYLMLLAPSAALCAIAAVSTNSWFKDHNLVKFAFIPMLLLAFISIHGSWKIITYLSKPEYSFYQMANGVKNIIQSQVGTTRGVILFGDIADSVSLEIGTDALNTDLWLIDTAVARMEKYHPSYLIVHTSNIDQIAVSLGAKVTELGRWDVFNNYYANGEQVRLDYVTWPVNNGP